MFRISPLVAAVAAFLALSSDALGQNLLDRVEKALDRGAPAADAPADGAAPPALGGDELPAPAEPESGYLGVGLEESPAGGILVTEIAPESPAEKAGLKVGDKITAVNKAAVEDISDLGELMSKVPPGGKLALGVQRAGAQLTIVATLIEPPGESPAAEGDPRPEPRIELGSPLGPDAGNLPPPAEPPAETPDADEAAGRASLGVRVVTFNEDARLRSDVPARTGALVTSIRPQSPADRAGLPVGAVIVAYDGQRIDTADELVAAIGASRPGDEVEITYYRGGTVSRKDVTLVAAADPSLLAPGTGGLRGRPLLDRVERGLDGPARPEVGASDRSAIIRRAPAAAADSPLHDEIAALKERIETLEMRLAELEGKLPVERPAPGADDPAVLPVPDGEPPAAAPGAAPADDEPAPTVRPPLRRPPTTVPKLKIKDE